MFDVSVCEAGPGKQACLCAPVVALAAALTEGINYWKSANASVETAG